MARDKNPLDPLLLMLDFAISQSTKRLGRDPSAQEILDFLFAGRRDSPNIQRMEREVKALMRLLQAEAKECNSQGEGAGDGKASGEIKCRDEN